MHANDMIEQSAGCYILSSADLSTKGIMSQTKGRGSGGRFVGDGFVLFFVVSEKSR